MPHDADLADDAGSSPTTWHLCWQAAVGREFLCHPSLHARIRDRLIDAHRRPGRSLVDYCLLPTEIHVLTQIPPGRPPGEVARAIGNVVSRWVREAQAIRSPVFAGPFRAYRLDSVEELRQQVRMLAWRPVALGLCRRPTHCAYGALRIALGMTPGHGFDARPLLVLFGPTVVQARASLRRWVGHCPTDRDWRTWELARGLALASGSVGPRSTMAREVESPEAAALIAAGGSGSVDGALRLLTVWVSAALGHGAPGLLQGSDATAARGRALVARIAVEHGLCSAASVARFFGRSKATLCEQMRASRMRASDAPIVETPIHRVVRDAAAPDPLASVPSPRREARRR